MPRMVELLMLGQGLERVMLKRLQKQINKPSGVMSTSLGTNSSLRLTPTALAATVSMVSLKQLSISTPP